MKISELQSKLIDRMKEHLSEWKFVKGDRTFKKMIDGNVWHFHISCINHSADFDCTGDVAVEFKSEKVRICIVGAELGNIEGVVQKRFSVSNEQQVIESADALYNYFCAVGIPFLHRYNLPSVVVDTLISGGKEALLISPVVSLHKQQIDGLVEHYGAGM